MHLFGQKKEILLFDELDSVKVDFNLPTELYTQIKMIGLAEDDIKRLKVLQSIVITHTDSLVDTFYKNIMNEPSLMEIINKHSSVEKLGKTLYNHIIEIFSGKVNAEYVAQRKRIAHVHVRIGLGTKWYVNAFQQLMNALAQVFYKEIKNTVELYQSVSSLQKIFNLEQQLVLESYELKEEAIRQLQEQEKERFQQTMRESAHELSAIAQETSASLQDLVSQFSNIQTLTDNGHKAIQTVESLSEDGKVRMGEEKKSVEKIKSQLITLSEDINNMFHVSKKIDSVVDVVASIANQINLLALNATIESARAGEHGRGFSVVANEIRNLSNLTKKSTEDIASLVKEISYQVQHVSHSVVVFNEDISSNEKITEETIEFFNKIVEAVKQSKEKTEVVFKEIKNSDSVLNKINDSTKEISQTAEMLSI